tara:strand:- start:1908 stop:2198 length:291 start_codon:yes stop_codon:yes gene_type:complete
MVDFSTRIKSSNHFLTYGEITSLINNKNVNILIGNEVVTFKLIEISAQVGNQIELIIVDPYNVSHLVEINSGYSDDAHNDFIILNENNLIKQDYGS